ncbi:hypothetical protein [Xenorhabdus bovienii]|uniref:hypothetical protein n=1 Tax=Xenorhabdus bovienii TaxID=40576 RepID=UPI003DA48DC9
MVLAKVGSTLSNDIQIELLNGHDHVKLEVINLTSGLDLNVLESYLINQFEEYLKGEYRVYYKGAPKWVITARIKSMKNILRNCNES